MKHFYLINYPTIKLSINQNMDSHY